jgi:prepilin-type N-terminal cleavage/methylation domain-containing protein
MIRTHCRRPAGGFSLLELMIVVAIALVLAGLAIPGVMNAIYNSRLRSATANVSGVLQNGRMESIKRNKTISVHFGTVGSGAVAYVDVNGDNNAANTEPQTQLGSSVTKSASPPSAISTTALGFTSPVSTDPSFNSRGLPCSIAGSPPTTTCPAGFVFYFTDSRPVGTVGWSAVSITPAGRIKTWFYDGSAWAN